MSSNTTFVAAAFLLTWVVIVGYLYRLRQATRDARATLAREIKAGVS
jgi:hypothetical protein